MMAMLLLLLLLLLFVDGLARKEENHQDLEEYSTSLSLLVALLLVVLRLFITL